MSDKVINIAGVVQDSIVDGPGLRLVIFAQGCARHCPGCHNPETWDFNGGTPKKIDDLLELAKRNPLCRSVTFSGGEPFAQAEAFADLAELLHEQKYEVASYTGFLFEELIKGTPDQTRLLQNIDILIDSPFILAERTLDLPFRGSRNQRILDVPASLKAGTAIPCIQNRWISPKQ